MNAPRFLDNEGYGPVRPPLHDDYDFELKEGQQAYIDGRALDTNDYPLRNPNGEFSKSHQAWKAGWLLAARCQGAY